MTDEVLESKPEVDETTDQTAPVDETNEDSKLSEESKPESVDYEALLAEEQEKRRKAEEKIVKLKRGQEPQEELDFDVLADKVWQQIESKYSQREQDLISLEEDKMVNSVASNDAEAKLIKYQLENGIQRTGDLATDIENARALANKHKLIERNKELSAALKSKITQGSADLSGERTPQTEKPVYNSREQALLDRMKLRYGKK